MTDYTMATGSTGTMMIRDTGTDVEFWLKAGNNTYNYQLPWQYTVNGVNSGPLQFRFVSGGAWQLLGRWNVTTDQTVTFYLAHSGTGGIGGPTSFSVAIGRTSAPGTPDPWSIQQIADTWVQGFTNHMPNGGIAIDQVQVRYDDSSTAASPAYFDPGTDGYGSITGLLRGKTYYFWVRTHNSKGWSGWSSRTHATTHDSPPAPTTPALSEIKQTSLKMVYFGNGDGGSPITAWETGYGTDPNAPQTTVTGSNLTLTDLSPGQVYYVWGRGWNQYGPGAWSARSTATLLAGAWVDVDGVKKRAVPYVRDGGVWKLAVSWAKIEGLWKESG
ncbi:MAG: fibronectin type III domain-containing protein [Saprospiraceae bacterium]|nr:fibronectin type III domain-containing protein [Candidatus Brachybacter algidus]